MWNIVIGVIFILGGLSGTMALRGTQSTIGLAVFGAILVVWGIIQMSSNRRSGQAPPRLMRRRRRPPTGPARGLR